MFSSSNTCTIIGIDSLHLNLPFTCNAKVYSTCGNKIKKSNSIFWNIVLVKSNCNTLFIWNRKYILEVYFLIPHKSPFNAKCFSTILYLTTTDYPYLKGYKGQQYERTGKTKQTNKKTRDNTNRLPLMLIWSVYVARLCYLFSVICREHADILCYGTLYSIFLHLKGNSNRVYKAQEYKHNSKTNKAKQVSVLSKMGDKWTE